MKHICLFSALIFATSGVAYTKPDTQAKPGGNETKVVSRIVSIGLFKNGLALVRREFEVSKPGLYRLDRVPRPVHGTFWMESNAKVTARSAMRKVEVPMGGKDAPDFQEDLAGSEVTVFFSDGNIPPVTGVVAALNTEVGDGEWARNYEDQYQWWSRQGRQVAGKSNFLIIESDKGLAYIDKTRIAYLQSAQSEQSVVRERPVILFDVADGSTGGGKVVLSYLTKGIAWAPSFRVDISDDKVLKLSQKAIIRNELEDFRQATLHLISGFPSMQFGHVDSLISPDTSWASFFQQLQMRVGDRHDTTSNVISQQHISFNAPASNGTTDLSATPSGEGVDLHYQDAGNHDMKTGDSLLLQVASTETDYKRIVEWLIPDTRNPDGRFIKEHQRNQDPEKYDDSPWDALRFRNPFEFPMTTAPAMIVAKGLFNGQQTSYWVNTGEETTLRVTKALSVRTRHIEKENSDETRGELYVGGRRFRKVTVDGEVHANNHRKEKVTMVIRRSFSGNLLSASGDPESSLLESGVYSVNKRNELLWKVDLEPGEEIKRTYQYKVLVAH